ncbi:MAG: ANTAR domain-containing protein [Methylocella sp.]
MTTPRLIQNFRNSCAVLLGGEGIATDTLRATLLKLGVTLKHIEQTDLTLLDSARDILLVDGDSLLDPVSIRATGAALPPAPAIGLVGVEAPSRLKALADVGVTAFLRKPVHAAAVYSSLFLAVNGYRRLQAMEQRLADYDRRRRGRRFVIKAVVHLVQTHGLNDDEAYELLRRASMRERQGLEEYCEAIIAAMATEPPAADETLPPRGARSSSANSNIQREIKR